MIDLPYHTVLIKVDQCEPVAQTAMSGFVLFAQHEPYKVFIVHFVLLVALELPRNLFEYPIHCFPRQGMTFITREVLFVNEEVMIGV